MNDMMLVYRILFPSSQIRAAGESRHRLPKISRCAVKTPQQASA